MASYPSSSLIQVSCLHGSSVCQNLFQNLGPSYPPFRHNRYFISSDSYLLNKGELKFSETGTPIFLSPSLSPKLSFSPWQKKVRLYFGCYINSHKSSASCFIFELVCFLRVKVNLESSFITTLTFISTSKLSSSLVTVI